MSGYYFFGHNEDGYRCSYTICDFPPKTRDFIADHLFSLCSLWLIVLAWNKYPCTMPAYSFGQITSKNWAKVQQLAAVSVVSGQLSVVKEAGSMGHDGKRRRYGDAAKKV
jgi:hypothetical protein